MEVLRPSTLLARPQIVTWKEKDDRGVAQISLVAILCHYSRAAEPGDCLVPEGLRPEFRGGLAHVRAIYREGAAIHFFRTL